ncbi:hypothetical protein BJY16_005037 [Actinoplanes octamycinicus]|uniref:Uncharacterized protein n=1 Tax=Actinoplanes octamycinicus TaxID=135948 RepID=A0A7W7H0A3_9ACTN|nr:hypothetical protein [Actinoplanes octamycinicus]MBB4741578.1 hypothetical protein [Actinoplanes octamycinicus]GIE57130.1 hypothetical protein Aoc01nite_25320 [Actinoplanes octamycinicus]
MTEQADRFTLTIGPDGRGLLTLALRRLPGANADGYARAQRYWACAPAGTRPRWLALSGAPHVLQRPGEHVDDPREAAGAHAAAEAYLPGVACSRCGGKWWKPANREAVTRYVLTGRTEGCLSCEEQPVVAAAPAAVTRPAPVPAPVAAPVSAPAAAPAAGWTPMDFGPPQTVDARILTGVNVHLDGAAAAMLLSASGGDTRTMSSLVSDLITRTFSVPRTTDVLI